MYIYIYIYIYICNHENNVPSRLSPYIYFQGKPMGAVSALTTGNYPRQPAAV